VNTVMKLWVSNKYEKFPELVTDWLLLKNCSAPWSSVQFNSDSSEKFSVDNY
jgi:hypothetical protein